MKTSFVMMKDNNNNNNKNIIVDFGQNCDQDGKLMSLQLSTSTSTTSNKVMMVVTTATANNNNNKISNNNNNMVKTTTTTTTMLNNNARHHHAVNDDEDDYEMASKPVVLDNKENTTTTTFKPPSLPRHVVVTPEEQSSKYGVVATTTTKEEEVDDDLFESTECESTSSRTSSSSSNFEDDDEVDDSDIEDAVIATNGDNSNNTSTNNNNNNSNQQSLLVLILISNQSFDREVSVRQQLAYTILNSHDIPFETIDGADPANKTVRNDLFAISGLHAKKYPQFFVIGETISYWGDWERFNASNEIGTLQNEILLRGYNTTDDDDDDESHHSLLLLRPSVDDPVLLDDTDDDEQQDVTTPDTTATTTTTNNTNNNNNNNNIRLLVLVSKQTLDPNITTNQERALQILNDSTNNAISSSYEIIDGSDPAQIYRRNELFELSKLRGIYPQFFIVDEEAENDGTTTTTTFWGDWNRFVVEKEAASLMITELGGGGGGTESTDNPTQGTTTTTTSSSSGGGSGSGSGTGMAGKEEAASSQRSENKSSVDNATAVADATETKVAEKQTDITIYGATSFVAKHILNYLRQVSLSFSRDIKITLAGRNRSKLESLKDDSTKKMNNLKTVMGGSSGGKQGQCVFDVMVAESTDAEALNQMAERTCVVINCAGPFAKYSTNVVAVCAKIGTDYVDITGEIGWAGLMREKYGKLSTKSGARIISFCGFDSIPSDLAVYAAVEALRDATKTQSVDVELATTWHDSMGGVNGGTLSTVVDMPLGLNKLFQWVPFLLDDPLVLTHPKVKSDPASQETRNRLALAEWYNQLPHLDSIFRMGCSIPFFMALVNAKIVHASAVALKYGSKFRYRERMVPTGYRMTTHLSLLSVIPAIITQVVVIIASVILKTPLVGRTLVSWFLPPGTGSSDHSCQAGYAHVYAEVSTAPNEAGACNKANCFLNFQGDPGNLVTAQSVSEAALTMLFDKKDLPQRSEDGFGTPAELLGKPLLRRLQNTSTRPVVVETNVRKDVGREWRAYLC